MRSLGYATQESFQQPSLEILETTLLVPSGSGEARNTYHRVCIHPSDGQNAAPG